MEVGRGEGGKKRTREGGKGGMREGMEKKGGRRGEGGKVGKT